MIGILIFILGLIVGSFLNVCIYRIPRRESVISPRSHCVSCGKTIPWYDNIPLLSFLLLNGRCRFCKARISFIYFTVELLTALLCLLIFMHFGLSMKFVIFAALGCALIVISFIDLKIQEIPDEITIPGIAIGVLLSFIFPELILQKSNLSGLFQSILGMVVGGAIIYLMGIFGKALFKKEAMGGGDVKLMAMLGAFLGWRLILLTFFLAPFFGSVVGIILKIKHKAEVIPYGPHLSVAGIIAMLWGEKILSWIIV